MSQKKQKKTKYHKSKITSKELNSKKFKTRKLQRLSPSPVWKSIKETPYFDPSALGQAQPKALAPFKMSPTFLGGLLVTFMLIIQILLDWYVIAGIIGFILLLAWLGSVIG